MGYGTVPIRAKGAAMAAVCVCDWCGAVLEGIKLEMPVVKVLADEGMFYFCQGTPCRETAERRLTRIGIAIHA